MLRRRQTTAGFRIVAFGDSLVAGYGLAYKDGFTVQLEDRLRQSGYGVSVANAGVSGDTTGGGLARLDWVLDTNPDLMLLCLGINDALCGIAPERIHSNLAGILQRATDRSITVLLAGLRLPAEFGVPGCERFNGIFPELAQSFDVPLYPDFLAGVLGITRLNLADGLHPNRRGIALIVDRLLPVLLPLLPPPIEQAHA